MSFHEVNIDIIDRVSFNIMNIEEFIVRIIDSSNHQLFYFDEKHASRIFLLWSLVIMLAGNGKALFK